MNTATTTRSQYIIRESSDEVMRKEGNSSQHAYEIAGLGDYDTILENLKAEHLLETEMERVREKFASAINVFPELSESDLEMLTILDLFDPGTSEHSAAVLELAHTKTEKPLASQISLADVFAYEDVPLTTFKRAAFFHDVGKVFLPRYLIQHPADNDTMRVFLTDAVVRGRDEKVAARLGLDLRDPLTHDEEALNKYFSERHIHAARYVPVSAYLSESELNELTQRGYSHDRTLFDILSLHEQKSEDLLKAKGFHLAGELAGQHHNYRKTEGQHPISIGTLHISVDVADLLHLVDMTQALLSTRSYKEGYTLPRVLQTICREAKEGQIPAAAAYLWVHDELSTISEEEERVYTEDDRNLLKEVRDFVDEARRHIEEEAPEWYTASA